MRKAYPQYKDSGVHWLGEIPTHWVAEKFAYHFVSGMGETILATELSDDGIPVYSATQEDKWFGFVEKAGLLLEPGDIVIPARGNSIGHVKLVKQRSTTTQTTIYSKAIRKSRNEPRFIKYFLEGNRKTLFEYDQTAIPQITVSQVSKNKIAIPPKDEQATIANYLDQETGKIDALIVKKNEFIDRLKEKRTALISQVVTRGLPPEEAQKHGLPPNSKMKPSGVGWLGEIPEHWNVDRLRRRCMRVTDGAHISPDLSSGDFPFVSTVDISKFGKIDFENCLKTSAESYEYLERNNCRPFPGDILFSKDGTIGRTSFIDFDLKFVVASSLIIISPKSNVLDSKYLEFWLNNSLLQQYVLLQIAGAAIRRISIEKVGRLPVLLPPVNEQKLIATYLSDQLAKLDCLVLKVEAAIDTLIEYRAALIASAVTGKIDVRGAAK